MTSRELDRLAELHALHVLDTAPEDDFDDLVGLASRIAGVPTALVSLVDNDRQWFKARVGMAARETGRDVAFCDVVVRTEAELEVPDARLDPRFADNSLVTGDPHIVFYAGFPLVAREGLVVGTLCVIGYQPAELTEGQRRDLRVLARQVMTQLELRRRTAEQAAELTWRREAEAELVESRRSYQLLAEHSTDIISRHDATGRVNYVSPSVRTVLGYDPAAEISENAAGHVHPEDLPVLQNVLQSVAQGGSHTATVRTEHADGSWRWMEITLSPLLDLERGLVEVYSAARDVTERVQTQLVIEDNAEFVRAVLDSVAVGIVACDAAGRLTLFNQATQDFHGIAADAEVPPEEWAERFGLFHADGSTPLAPHEVPLAIALRDGIVEGAEIVIAPHGLPARLVSCDGRALRDATGHTVGAVIAMTDITATREAERRLREAHDALSRSTAAMQRSEASFRSAFENGPMSMCRLDEAGVVTHANPAMRRLLSLSSGQLIGRRFAGLAAQSDRSRLALALAGAGVQTSYVEALMRQADGRSTWCEIAVSAGAEPDGTSYLLVQLADIQGRKQRESELERRVARDDLTGLANRVELKRRLDELLLGDRAVSVLFLDLDGFKRVNDSAGHAAGDEVLVEVARRLSALVRSEDLVARLGGDEFVLVRHDNGSERTATLVDRVQCELARPFTTGWGEHHIGASVGVVLAQPGDDATEVLARADAAMYDAKRLLTVIPAQPAAPSRRH